MVYKYSNDFLKSNTDKYISNEIYNTINICNQIYINFFAVKPLKWNFTK